MIVRRALVAALALAALVPAGCSDDGPDEGEARLEVDGRAEVQRSGGGTEVVDDGTDLGPGDRVEVTEGTATMALAGGVRFELRAGVGDAGDTRVEMADVPVLEAGDLLVLAPDDGAAVEAAGTTVAVDDGAAQVSRALGMGVAAYDAEVSLDSAGQERTVPALREMRVPALGRPPQAPRPLDYDEHDPWDRRFLGTAIELGDRLERLAEGYTRNLRAGEGRTPGFFRIILPGLADEAQFDASLIALDRAPGETLIGAAIADLGRRGDFVDRWRSVFEFRDAGARWGLVALDQDVSGPPLLGAVEQAVSASPLDFAAPPTTGATTTSTAPPDTTPPSTSPPSTSPPSTGPPPTSPPTTEEPITPVLDPVVDPVAEAVTGLVNGLLGLFDPPAG